MVIAEGGGNPERAMSFRRYKGGPGEGQLALKGENQDLMRRERDMHVVGNHLSLPPPPAEIKLHTSSNPLASHHCKN